MFRYSKSRLPPVCRLVWLLMLVAAPLIALDPDKAITQYGLRAWRSEDGLPQSAVYSMAQTQNGYLWFGTTASVARFDGVQFSVFDRRSTPALATNHVRGLL